MIFFSDFFSQKTRFDISCKLSPLDTTGIKCQNMFSEKTIKKILQSAVC